MKRDRILLEADKLAAKGKLDAAIREYRRALDQSPNDTNTLNRLGDLLVRVNRIDEAIEAYQRIAAHFADDGFFLKAIAIYKKINRLDPQHTQIYEKLADLYFKQGLIVEGRQQLLTLADWFLRARNTDEAIRLYRRLTQLEPTNFQVRAKLVDLLIQSGDRDHIADDIRALAGALLSRGLLDEAVKLGHRSLEVGPPATSAVADVAAGLMEAGRRAEAVRLIEDSLAAGESSPRFRDKAARVFHEAGDDTRAREILEKLIAEQGETPERALLYGDVSATPTTGSEPEEDLLLVVDKLAATGERLRAATMVKGLLRKRPDDMDVLERAVSLLDRPGDADLLLRAEITLADLYYQAGQREESCELYRQLQSREPHTALFSERLRLLGGAGSSGLDDGVPPLETHAASGGVNFDSVDVELSFDGEDGRNWQAEESATVRVPSVPEAFAAPEESQDTNAEELYTEAVVFAKYGLTEKAVSHLHRLLALDPGHANGRTLLTSMGGGELVEIEPDLLEERQDELQISVSSEDREEHREAAPEPVEKVQAKPSPPKAKGEPTGEHFLIDLPSLEDVEEQPVRAAKTQKPSGVRLEELEAILGIDTASTTKRRPASPRVEDQPISFEPLELAESCPRQDSAPAPSFDVGTPLEEEVPSGDRPVELIDVADVLSGPGDPELRELDALIGEGDREVAGVRIDELRAAFGDHPDLMSRQALLKAQGWDESSTSVVDEVASASELFQEEDQFFDLAAELERELADEELVAEATGVGRSQEASIEELFREFQRGVAEQLGEEDFDTHFNLGLAYREMGLIDEAIGEFQLSAKADHLFVESASMIGSCYLEKGLAEEAASWFDKALKAPDLAAEAALGLRYELGRALETCGNTSSALANYAEVLALNPSFRDVVDRVARLRSN